MSLSATLSDSRDLPSPLSPAPRRVGFPTHAVFLAAMIGTCWFASAPRGLAVLGVVALWLLLAMYWCVRLVLFVARNVPRRASPSLSELAHWSVGPIITAISYALVVTDVPMRVRFEASRSAMESAANDVRKGLPFLGPKWVGWYHVATVVYVDVTKCIFVSLDSDHGFVFGSEVYSNHSLGGGWYTFSHWPT